MTSSNRLDCTTGRSAGFAPFSPRPTTLKKMLCPERKIQKRDTSTEVFIDARLSCTAHSHHGRGVLGQRIAPQTNGTASPSSIKIAPTSRRLLMPANVSGLKRTILRQFAKADPEYKKPIPSEISS